MIKKYTCFIFAAIAFQQLFSQTSIIKNVTIIDVKTGKVVPGQSVVFNNEKIEMTGPAKKNKRSCQCSGN